MGTIRNRLTIVNDYNFDRITNTRQNAVEYFGKSCEMNLTFRIMM